MSSKVRVFYLIFLVISAVSSEEEKDEDFVATNEWQKIKEGQKIPRGLHVRINFQTGVKEAKLLNPDDNNDKQLSAISISESTIDRGEKFKNKYHNYEELKRTLEEINLTPKIDTEILRELLKSYTQAKDKKESLKIIKDLEFLTHQYDNAIEFVKCNGFKGIIYKNFNHTDDEIKIQTLKLFTSVTQNNRLTKKYALDSGSMGMILRLLNFELNNNVKNSAIIALGSLIRSFPSAQINFIEQGGFTVFSNIFNKDDVKLQIKAATLISDIVIDYQWSIKDDKLKELYGDFNLEDRVVQENWCENLNKLIYKIVIIDSEDHDSIEKCLQAMNTLASKCGTKLDRDLLKNLSNSYKILADHKDDLYFSIIRDLCDEIQFKILNNQIIKTEL